MQEDTITSESGGGSLFAHNLFFGGGGGGVHYKKIDFKREQYKRP